MIKTLTLSHPDISENISTYIKEDWDGENALQVANAADIVADNFLVIGLVGSEETEIEAVTSVDTQTEISTTEADFHHSAGTSVTVIGYDKYRLYRSVTGEGGIYSLLLEGDLQIDKNKNIVRDTSAETGYSYKFCYYNSITDTESSFSDEIPFDGYREWSLKMLQDGILSDFGDPDERMIKRADITRWLNYFYLEIQVLLMGGESPLFVDYLDITSTGETEYDLDDTNYEVLSVYMVELSSDGGVTFSEPINPKDFRFRDSSGDTSNYDYRMAGNKLYFTDRIVPEGNIIRVWYTTNPTSLVNPSDTLMNPIKPMVGLFHDYGMIKANEKDRRPDLNYAFEKRIKEAKADGGIIYKLRKRIRQGNMSSSSSYSDSLGGFING